MTEVGSPPLSSSTSSSRIFHPAGAGPRVGASLSFAIAILAIEVTGCGARSSLREGLGGASAQGGAGEGGGSGCTTTQVDCGGSCCDGLCVADVCQTVAQVADCARQTPQAKPIAILRGSNNGVADLDLQNIAVQNGFVYYASEGHIARVPSHGGPSQIVSAVALDPTSPSTSLLVDAKGPYFEAALGVFATIDGSLVQVTGPTNIAFTRHLAITADALVVTQWNTPQSTFTFSFAPFSGANPFTVFTSPPGQFQTITADATAAYFSISSGIFRMRSDGAVDALSSTPADLGPASLAVDASFLYASYPDLTNGQSRIGKIDKNTGGTFDTMAKATALHIEVDDHWLYVHGGTPKGTKVVGSIFRLQKTGDPTLIPMVDTGYGADGGSASYETSALAVDEKQIYFIESCHSGTPESGTYRLVTLPKDFAQ